jgi:hypothetical protein
MRTDPRTRQPPVSIFTSTAPQSTRPAAILTLALSGFVLGLLIGQALDLLSPVDTLPDLPYFPITLGAVGFILSITRLRWFFWGFTGLTIVCLLLVAYTPIIHRPALQMVRQDPLSRCDALFDLCASVRDPGGLLTVQSEERLQTGLDLIRQGWAPVLLIDHFPPPNSSPQADIRRQLNALHIPAPPIVDLGNASNTYEEGRLLVRTCRAHGFHRILVITSPLHTRRAGAVFERAGIQVVVRPCVERQYDLTILTRPSERLAAFREWIHEAIGMQVYRWRGWIA